MRRVFRSPGLWVALGLLIVAGLVMAVRARGPVVATTLASRTAIEQHVVASGRVRAVTRIKVSAQVSGRVVSVGAVEGRRVKAGELLVQLDDSEARAAVSQARASLRQAAGRVDLKQVGTVVTSEASRQAAANLARAESELVRAERLAAGGIASRVDLEDARRAVDVARAQTTAALAQQAAAAPAGADTNIARSAVVESQAVLASATARFELTRIRAERDGIILERLIEPGDTVQPGTPLLDIVADGETQLVIEPDERHLAWIRLGQKARASADAYPRDTFEAEVEFISPAVDPKRGSIEVRLRVSAPPDVLKPDMTVSVDLTVAAKAQALVVPTAAVRGAETTTPWVFVVQDGRIVRRDVTLGIRGDGSTEIATGLDAGAEVVLGSGVGLTPGQRVRVERGAR